MNVATDWIINNYIEIFGAVAGIIYVFLEIRQNIWLWPVGIVTSAVYVYVFFTGKLYADMGLQGYYLAISVVGWYWWLRGSGRRLRSEATKSRKAGAQGSGQEGEKRREGEEEKEKGKGRGGEGEKGRETKRLRDEETEGQKGSNQGIPSLEGFGVGVETERLSDEGTEGLKVSRLNLKTAIILAIVFSGLLAIMWFILDRFTDSPVPMWDSFITSLSIVATWMLARKIYEHWLLWIIVNTAAAILFFTRELYPTVVLYFIYLVLSFVGLKAWKSSIQEKLP